MLAEIEKASSDELIALAAKLERLMAFKRAIDSQTGEKGDGLVHLTGREIELIAYCVRRVGAERWRFGE